MQRILEVRVLANVDPGDHATELARFAPGYDSSWQEWCERFSRGEAVVARLTTTVRFEADRREGKVEVVNDGVWLEVDQHLPKVEEQVREVAYKDARELEARLWREGVHVSAREIEEMFVHVALGDDLEQVLLGAVSTTSGRASARPDGVAPSPAGRAGG